MSKQFSMTSWILAAVLPALAALSAGCARDSAGGYVFCTDKCADIPCGAIPPPAGTYNCRWQNEQAARAQLDFFVVHHYEWYMGGDKLGPDGRRHIRGLAKRLGELPTPVIVAESGDDKLDAARKQNVAAYLTELGVPNAEGAVVIGGSEAEGLYGQNAVRLGNVRLGGTAAGGTGTGFGGTPGGTNFGGTTGGGFGYGTTFGGGLGGGMGGGMGIY